MLFVFTDSFSSDSQLLECGRYTRKLVFQRSSAGDGLKLYYISLDHVGVDVHETFTPKYSSPPATTRVCTVKLRKKFYLLCVCVCVSVRVCVRVCVCVCTCSCSQQHLGLHQVWTILHPDPGQVLVQPMDAHNMLSLAITSA